MANFIQAFPDILKKVDNIFKFAQDMPILMNSGTTLTLPNRGTTQGR